MAAIAITRQGRLRGEERDGLSIFRGVPFAAPPVGARRWLPPAPPEPWSGEREAVRFASCAPQNLIPLDLIAAFKIHETQSEDCLYLNVWTPAADGALRPVLVWIHGGAFAIGSGAQSIYDGAALAKRGDVVVVTVNYRLGPLGFLRLSELTNGRIPSTGNEGILDQVAALEWVRENIAAFGGDPENVTIFGESAGGMSVGTLLGLPRARGLFQRAIPQSGAGSTANTRERAVRVAERFASHLGVGRDPDALRSATPAQLLAAATALGGQPGLPDHELGGMPLQPVIDGEVQPRLALESVARGSAAGVALMLGTTLEEWKLFVFADPSNLQLSDAQLLARYERRMGGAAGGVVDAYHKARSERSAPPGATELWSALETDRIFRLPALRLAEEQARHDARVYSYLFTWRSPMFGGMLGACHALELGFAFGTYADPGMADFSGQGPKADALSAQMMDAWLAFARSGDPSTPALRWPRYTSEQRATCVFGEETAVANAPFDEERRAWSGAPDSVLGAV
ncbi:MAG TPA: carboxylesterase/lipase family protein [Myxococcota bacterium]|nr:carboxylesterase/lipase family protein [Myxococcota bacterium]